jgi:hypothetical protein
VFVENAMLRVLLMPISCTAAVDPRPPAAVGLSVGFAAIFAAFSSAA